uniref:Uncharacterized protein n=1 Tax=Anopheles culicifacies TaxID=139723 RepID=A0A182M0V2_9DIPT
METAESSTVRTVNGGEVPFVTGFTGKMDCGTGSDAAANVVACLVLALWLVEIGTLVSVLLLLLLLVLWPLVVVLVDVPVRIVADCATTEEAVIAVKDSFLRDSSPDLSY